MEMEERRNRKEQSETGGKHSGSKRGFSNMRDFSIMGCRFHYIWRCFC